MLEANVIFTLDGVDVTIQCSKEDKIKDICQKFANKVQKNINSLLFLYGGNQLNFLASFKDLAKDKNEIKVLVYTNEDEDGFKCPRCGEKIKIKVNLYFFVLYLQIFDICLLFYLLLSIVWLYLFHLM